ncbi:MAG: hypothetical protein JXA96_08675 [Sedimentisphaerales bacterium]|nr:hypothetical protein [Sedimentisphaerales bacterium]
MAAITFTLEELLEILKSNNLLHKQIVRSEVKNDCIEFIVDTKMFMLPVVPVSLKYISYENNVATFEVSLGNAQFNQALGMLGNSYQSKLPEFVKLDLPNVLVDLQQLLEHKNIKGIQIKEITQTGSQLTIVTE